MRKSSYLWLYRSFSDSVAARSMSSASRSSPYHSKRPRRFAPLNADVENKHNAPKLRGIIFDVDGTLCLPQNYMFREMREALSIPRSVDILDHIKSLSDVPDDDASEPSSHSPRSRAQEAIRKIERRAMTSQRPQPGLSELMSYLTKRGVRKALCTRNFALPVEHLLTNYLPGEVFSPIVTRETEGVQPKPSPEGLWYIAQQWGLDRDLVRDQETGFEKLDGTADPLDLAKWYLGEGLIMVGDSVDDMAAGKRAGAATVLLVNEDNENLKKGGQVDLGIRRLDQLIEVLDTGFEARS